MKVYPLFLVGLEQRRCVVVGGDAEAERKVAGLLAADASVTLIAPQATNPLMEHAASGRVSWVRRRYRQGDFEGAFLVIVTEKDEATRAATASEAASEGALINVVDDVAHCNFIAGSVVRRGPLVVSISTSGCAPALAVRLREKLERELGEEYAEFLERLGRLREPLAALDFETRRALWYRLVDSDAVAQIRAGRPDLARERIDRVVAEATAARR